MNGLSDVGWDAIVGEMMDDGVVEQVKLDEDFARTLQKEYEADLEQLREDEALAKRLAVQQDPGIASVPVPAVQSSAAVCVDCSAELPSFANFCQVCGRAREGAPVATGLDLKRCYSGDVALAAALQAEMDEEQAAAEAAAHKKPKKPKSKACIVDAAAVDALADKFLPKIVKNKTLSNKNIKVERVRSKTLATKFEAMWAQFTAKYGTRTAAPALVFHGTASAAVPSIAKTGLVVPGQGNRIRVKNGQAMGKGIYCTSDIQMAMGYAMKGTGGTIIACAVLPGKSTSKSPGNNRALPAGTDSFRNGHVYVLGSSHQVLPLFLVTLEKGDGFEIPTMADAIPDYPIKAAVKPSKRKVSQRDDIQDPILASLHALSYRELVEECKDRGLSGKGKKMVLAKRLMMAMNQDDVQPPSKRQHIDAP